MASKKKLPFNGKKFEALRTHKEAGGEILEIKYGDEYAGVLESSDDDGELKPDSAFVDFAAAKLAGYVKEHVERRPAF